MSYTWDAGQVPPQLAMPGNTELALDPTIDLTLDFSLAADHAKHLNLFIGWSTQDLHQK